MAFDRGIRRRLLLGLLLIASLGLMTVFFREADDGRLHRAQDRVSAAATPFEAGVQRVAQPFRDAWSWSRDLVHAKQERDRLQRENERLRHDIGLLSQGKQDLIEVMDEAS